MEKFIPPMPLFSRRCLPTFEEVAKYLSFDKISRRVTRIQGVNPKYLAAGMVGGFFIKISP
jgi:hypothetical protein